MLLDQFLNTFGFWGFGWSSGFMMLIGLVFIFLGIRYKMEPLLLIPIGFSCILVNIPFSGLMEAQGLLALIYKYLIKTEIVPCLIFLGIGAMIDFEPLLANPLTFLLGAAAQIGIYCAMFLAIVCGFDIQSAATIGIIGGADGPTTIYTAVKLAPQILGPVTVAAYSYMSLVPIIQPPVMKILTTKKERKIEMSPLRRVSRIEKILFPLVCIAIVCSFVPSATPLIGMIMFGNLLKESGVTDRLASSAQNEIINISTVFLGLGVGATMGGRNFLNPETLLILGLGVVAFISATGGGVLLGKLMSLVSKGKMNPLIGAAGVSAVPMSARVVQKVGQKENPKNFLLMHAMGPNVAGVIGSATTAGIFLSLLR